MRCREALAKDGEVLFPDQASFFYAGKIANELGAFIQMTYDGVADHFGIDNTDIRYAHHLSFGGADGNSHNMILGVTLNNNPTVQDVWNSTPAWGFPYSGVRSHPGRLQPPRSMERWLKQSPDSVCTCGLMIIGTPKYRATAQRLLEALIRLIAPRVMWPTGSLHIGV